MDHFEWCVYEEAAGNERAGSKRGELGTLRSAEIKRLITMGPISPSLDLDGDNIFMKDNPLLKWQVLSRFCQPAHLDSHQFVIVLGGL